MKRFALATSALLTLAVAAPAFASDQLATVLGVQGQGFSQSELIQLKAANDDGDATRINFLLENGGAASVTASTKSAAEPGVQQLAASLGVNAADYSRGELVALKAALDDGDSARINALRDQAAKTHLEPSPAWTQLASSLGMDATTSSPAVLVLEHGED
ncbi:hypothetical protein [Aliiruegeria lutimaris]|uniref:DUF4142 domain-containing protein n=1 Tax=Aliiruegeria lutimaris TaxID=571298 RepID=A0A1G8R897_9RHOB|nr:hypothetical protein [Aliiruegeria lutimaris]SDJ12610.1 hypothetical protein SAMN04488026_101273 [Aliiruegeria lutimaris]